MSRILCWRRWDLFCPDLDDHDLVEDGLVDKNLFMLFLSQDTYRDEHNLKNLKKRRELVEKFKKVICSTYASHCRYGLF